MSLPSLPVLVGHVETSKKLFELIKADRFPPATMLAGQSGIGKAKLAKILAFRLLCSNPANDLSGACGTCPECRLLLAGNHPDFHYFDCLEENSGIKEVRQLLYQLALHPFRGKARVVLLDHSEAMTAAIANLLLKSLEEPAPSSFFILVCSNPSRLPSTLISRCYLSFCDSLKKSEVFEILLSQGMSSERAEKIAVLADGCLENVEVMESAGELYQEMRDSIAKIMAGSRSEALQLSSKLVENKDDFGIKLRLLRIIAREILSKEKQMRKAALFLKSALGAERSITERHLSPLLVFSNIFLPLTHSEDSLQLQATPASVAI